MFSLFLERPVYNLQQESPETDRRFALSALKLSRKHINSNISLWEGLEQSLFHDKTIIPYIQKIADAAYDLNFIHWDMEYVSIDDSESWNEFNRAHNKIYENMTRK